MQDESQLQEDASNWEAGRAVQNGRQSQGLELLSRHLTFGTVDRWLKKTKASGTRTQARWKLAVLFVQWCHHVPPFPAACASGIVSVPFFDMAI